jgi:hypothetical protein
MCEQHDWSSARAHLVASVPGQHEGGQPSRGRATDDITIKGPLHEPRRVTG